MSNDNRDGHVLKMTIETNNSNYNSDRFLEQIIRATNCIDSVRVEFHNGKTIVARGLTPADIVIKVIRKGSI